MSDLEGIRPPGPVTRIGRRPNPWAWPPWEAQHSDATFGNRWDDPEGNYRVLYAATQLEGAYVEVLSRFRPDPVVVAELGEARAVPQMRKHVALYLKGIAGAAVLRERIMRIDGADETIAVIEEAIARLESQALAA